MKSFFTACLFFSVSSVMANTVELTPAIDKDSDNVTVETTHTLYFSLGQAYLDSEKSTAEGVEDSALSIRIAWEGSRDSWVFGAGLSGLIYSDNRDFNQSVVDQFGNYSSASSDAQSVSLFGEVGYRYTLSQQATVEFLGGYEAVMSSSRSISNCSNCLSEDIELDSGMFIGPRVTYRWSNGVKVYLLWNQHLSGDIESNIMLSLGLKI
ncbi:MAG: hypothetical protein AAGB12_08255 [Pseudomonadota bacterium]